VTPTPTCILGIEIDLGGRDFLLVLHVLHVLSSVLQVQECLAKFIFDFLYLFCFPGEDQPKGDDSTRVDEAEV
jgi:hypothetical protein